MPRKSDSAREALLDALCAHVLDHGLAHATLRPMAKAVGTSDRMLIYRFGSKERLIEAVMIRLATRLAAELSESIPPRRARSLSACGAEILSLMRSSRLKPYIRVWLEIVASAQSNSKAFGAIGHQLLSGFLPWVEERLPIDAIDRKHAAASLLTMIEGALVLDAVGMNKEADRAIAYLSKISRT